MSNDTPPADLAAIDVGTHGTGRKPGEEGRDAMSDDTPVILAEHDGYRLVKSQGLNGPYFTMERRTMDRMGQPAWRECEDETPASWIADALPSPPPEPGVREEPAIIHDGKYGPGIDASHMDADQLAASIKAARAPRPPMRPTDQMRREAEDVLSRLRGLDQSSDTEQRLARDALDLLAVVSRLPKTADGLPVTDHDTVWVWTDQVVIGLSYVYWRAATVRPEAWHGHSAIPYSKCYSTREAAEAANARRGSKA